MPSDRRLHPLSILFGFTRNLNDLLLPGLLVLLTASRREGGWEVWAMLLAIPYAVLSLGRYLTFTYRYETDDIVVREGLLFRNERHVPYARIQNLDSVQTVLHRLGGVVEVRLQTGGGQEPEATLRVIALDDFEEMRRRVARGKEATTGNAVPAAGPADTAPRHVLVRVSAGDLVRFGLIENQGMVIVAAVLGLVWEAGLFERYVDPRIDADQGTELVRQVEGWVAAWTLLRGLALAAAVAMAFIVFVRVLSIAWALVRLHGFTLARAGADLRTDYGLLTRVSASIPPGRVQTLTMREGPLHRLFGRASMSAETAGGQGGRSGSAQREWLAPIVGRERLRDLVCEVLPDVDLAAVEWRPPHPGAMRRVLSKSLLAAATASVLVLAIGGWSTWPIVPVLLASATVRARLYVRHLGWATTDAAVLFRSGALTQQVSIARFAKMQALAVRESPFDRRAGMARVHVDTAGTGERSHRMWIPYLGASTARDLYDRLVVEAARTDFRT